MPSDRVVRALLALVSLLLPAGAIGQEYHVDREGDNGVTFISDAPIEDFSGVTDRVDGYVLLSAALSDGQVPESELYFEVDLNTLATGIRRRDRHMRENYLETGEFPYATFKGRLTEVQARAAGRWDVAARGDLTIHGTRRERTVACRITGNGAEYRVRCDFDVNISDHGIDVPALMFMKINEVVRLKLDFLVKRVES